MNIRPLLNLLIFIIIFFQIGFFSKLTLNIYSSIAQVYNAIYAKLTGNNLPKPIYNAKFNYEKYENHLLKKALGMKNNSIINLQTVPVLSSINIKENFLIAKHAKFTINQPVIYKNILIGFISKINSTHCVVSPIHAYDNHLSIIGLQSGAIALLPINKHIIYKLFPYLMPDTFLNNKTFFNNEIVITWQNSNFIPAGLYIGKVYDNKIITFDLSHENIQYVDVNIFQYT